MHQLISDKQALKKFGLTMAIAFICLSAILLFIKHSQKWVIFSWIAGLFYLSALTVPAILKPVYVVWMKLAHVLSWINTRLILTILFYLILTPIGLIMRIFGNDPLERKINKNAETYWKKREHKEFNPRDYERQF